MPGPHGHSEDSRRAGLRAVTGAPVCGAASCTRVTQPGLLTPVCLEVAAALREGHTDISVTEDSSSSCAGAGEGWGHSPWGGSAVLRPPHSHRSTCLLSHGPSLRAAVTSPPLSQARCATHWPAHRLSLDWGRGEVPAATPTFRAPMELHCLKETEREPRSPWAPRVGAGRRVSAGIPGLHV